MFQHVRYYFPRFHDLQQKMEKRLTPPRVRRARALCDRFFKESANLEDSWVYAHSCRWNEPQKHSPVSALQDIAHDVCSYVLFAEGKGSSE